jgi:hypothetical protein
VQMRCVVGGEGGGGLVLLEQVQLPLAPFDRLEPVALQAQHRVPARLLGVAQQEAAHVDAVDLAVVGQAAAAGQDQGGEQIDQVDQLVADLAGRHPVRPADDAGSPVGALQGGEVAAPPGSREPGPLAPEGIGVAGRVAEVGVGAVVGGPDHDRVLGDAQLVQGVEDTAGEGIHLREQIGQVAVLGRAGELRVGDGGIWTWV